MNRLITPANGDTPERGMLFTAYAMSSRKASQNGREPDPVIRLFRDWTGYVKLKSIYWHGDIIIDDRQSYYRFIVVDGPFTHTRNGAPHNHFLATVFRELRENELTGKCILSPQDYYLMKDVARGTKKETL